MHGLASSSWGDGSNAAASSGPAIQIEKRSAAAVRRRQGKWYRHRRSFYSFVHEDMVSSSFMHFNSALITK